MFLSLRGASIDNDGYVNIEDVYVGARGTNDDNNSLLCHTDNMNCCSSPVFNEWYLPDGTMIIPAPQRGGYHRNRNSDTDHVVRLYRAQGLSLPSAVRGRFRCEIDDSTGARQTLFANICMLL